MCRSKTAAGWPDPSLNDGCSDALRELSKNVGTSIVTTVYGVFNRHSDASLIAHEIATGGKPGQFTPGIPFAQRELFLIYFLRPRSLSRVVT